MSNLKPYREKTTDEMDLREFQEWANGHLILAIGRGDFRSSLSTIIQCAHKRGYDARKLAELEAQYAKDGAEWKKRHKKNKKNKKKGN